MANRYEKEISEILERMERAGPKSGMGDRFRRWRQRKTRDAQPAMSGGTTRWSPGRFMVIGLVLLVGSLIFARLLGPATPWIAIGGLLLLIAGYIAALSQTSGRGQQASWRGRAASFYSAPNTFSRNEILRRWRNWWRAHGVR